MHACSYHFNWDLQLDRSVYIIHIMQSAYIYIYACNLYSRHAYIYIFDIREYISIYR